MYDETRQLTWLHEKNIFRETQSLKSCCQLQVKISSFKRQQRHGTWYLVPGTWYKPPKQTLSVNRACLSRSPILVGETRRRTFSLMCLRTEFATTSQWFNCLRVRLWSGPMAWCSGEGTAGKLVLRRLFTVSQSLPGIPGQGEG